MEIKPIQTTGAVNVSELNNAIQETHIHIDLSKTFYSITPAELQILEEGPGTAHRLQSLQKIKAISTNDLP